MKTELNMTPNVETMITSVLRPTMVNEVTGKSAPRHREDNTSARPHILARRAARWARRSAY